MKPTEIIKTLDTLAAQIADLRTRLVDEGVTTQTPQQNATKTVCEANKAIVDDDSTKEIAREQLIEAVEEVEKDELDRLGWQRREGNKRTLAKGHIVVTVMPDRYEPSKYVLLWDDAGSKGSTKYPSMMDAIAAGSKRVLNGKA